MMHSRQRCAMDTAEVAKREPGTARQWDRIVRSGWNLSDFRAPSAERRAPSAERRAPSAERRAPSAERRAPSAERRAPSAERRAPSAERRAPSAAYCAGVPAYLADCRACAARAGRHQSSFSTAHPWACADLLGASRARLFARSSPHYSDISSSGITRRDAPLRGRTGSCRLSTPQRGGCTSFRLCLRAGSDPHSPPPRSSGGS